MKILLVGNYEGDGQESMLRFGRVLHRGFTVMGLAVDLIQPSRVVSRMNTGGMAKWLGYVDKFVLFPRVLRKYARRADVVHICDHSNAMYAAHLEGRPHVVTCNDMLAIRSARGEFPEHRTRATGRLLQRWILDSLRRAQRLTCVSQATRNDVIRLTRRPADQIDVTHMGLNYPYQPIMELAEASAARRRGEQVAPQLFERFGVPSVPYLLHVGGTQWYKNRSGAMATHGELLARRGATAPHMVIVGRRGAEVSPAVEHRSGVANDELAALYSAAECLVFPSLQEGFGWPILEAQACGCPVITTRRAPMTEVAAEAAVYLDDPRDITAGASAIESILNWTEAERTMRVQEGLRNAAKFTTERMLRGYVGIYEELCRG